jgi:lysophospholipase L1-like esterase
VGNGWTSNNPGSYIISSQKLHPTSNYVGNFLYRPSSETFKDGSESTNFSIADTDSGVGGIIGLVARYNGSEQYGAYFYDYNGTYQLALCIDDVASSDGSHLCQGGNSVILKNMSGTINAADIASGNARLELDAVSSADNGSTNLTVSVYNNQGEILQATDGKNYTMNCTNGTAALQNAGVWGLSESKTQTTADNFTVTDNDPAPTDAISTVDKNVQSGQPITLTVTGRGVDDTVLLSDNGSGSFSPNNLQLNSGNDYAATTVYTPSSAGQTLVKATYSSDGTTVESNSFLVWPYSTEIGFIGDSITYGNGDVNAGPAATIADLGSGTSLVNAGISGSKSWEWADDSATDSDAYTIIDGGDPVAIPADYPLLSTATDKFQQDGVQIVNIMLGTNDANTVYNDDPAATPASYKVHIQAIVDALKVAGIKHVILSNPPYNSNGNHNLNYLKTDYPAMLDEIAADSHGFVLRGDQTAYDYFESHPDQLADGTHPTTDGYTALGGLWADAIKSDIQSQTNPYAAWQNSNSIFTNGDDSGLALTVQKYSGEFQSANVNGKVLAAADYKIDSGSTIVQLKSSYLNSLPAGTYNLTLRFYGGVNVNSQFTVQEQESPSTLPTIPTIPGVPDTGAI